MILLNEIGTSALAYLGDSVLELMVRERLVAQGISSAGKLNHAALDYVRASAQAAAMERIIPLLDEEEERFYHRGRNSTHLNFPKNATTAEYRRATGMETLFAYLHVSGKTERLRELFEAAYPTEEREETGKNKYQ